MPIVYCFEDFKSILFLDTTESRMMKFEFKQSTNLILELISNSDFPTTLLMHAKLSDEYFLCEGLLFALIHSFNDNHKSLRI